MHPPPSVRSCSRGGPGPGRMPGLRCCAGAPPGVAARASSRSPLFQFRDPLCPVSSRLRPKSTSIHLSSLDAGSRARENRPAICYHFRMPVDTEIQATHIPPLKAPRGTALTCKAWPQEAAMRMLMNNLDEEVGERPRDLVVYGGTGKAARNQQCLEPILASLKSLENDETLLVQSGKPVGIFKTHDYAPRVLIANSNLVGHWSNWEKFNELERAGLMMYGQMTAGSWIYIGS